MNSALSNRSLLASVAVISSLFLYGCQRQDAAQTATPQDVRAADRDYDVAVEPAEPSTRTAGQAGGLEVFLSEGRIERVDPQNARIVIAHEGVPGADIQAGTTEFVARERDPLSLVKPGQEIEFSFTRLSEGGYQLVDISPTPPPESETNANPER